MYQVSGLCSMPFEPCQVRKEAALRRLACVPQIPRDLTIDCHELPGFGTEMEAPNF